MRLAHELRSAGNDDITGEQKIGEIRSKLPEGANLAICANEKQRNRRQIPDRVTPISPYATLLQFCLVVVAWWCGWPGNGQLISNRG